MQTRESKIDQLVTELCPKGVEFKRLGEIMERARGTRITAAQMKMLHKNGAPIRIFAGGKTFADVEESVIPKEDIQYVESIIVKSRGIIEFEYYNKPFSHKAEFWSYHSNSKEINTKFIWYYLRLNEKHFQKIGAAMSKMPQISSKDTDRFSIPVPPIEVQKEIVRILDSFTQLEAELEAELEARRKQYEYYREEYYNFGDSIEKVPLGELGTFVRGNGLQKKDFVETGVPAIHYGQIYTHYGTSADRTKSFVSFELAKKLKKAETGNLVIATTSENDEDVCKAVVWLGTEPVAVSGDAHIFKHAQNPKYIAYYFKTGVFASQKKKYISGTKVRRVSSESLSKIMIPIPSLAEQERIAGILDKFDALVNDISTGLPAEIAARRKQYEYYRNRLLTFTPLTK